MREKVKLKWRLLVIFQIKYKINNILFYVKYEWFLQLNIRWKIRLKYFVMRNNFGIVIKKAHRSELSYRLEKY